tara:strand:- start:17 stop:235 length:219 start_codon:yes stop_codon:yes gene_type:complete
VTATLEEVLVLALALGTTLKEATSFTSSLVDSLSVVTLRTIAIAVVAAMEVVLGTDKTFAEQGAYYYSLTKD